MGTSIRASLIVSSVFMIAGSLSAQATWTAVATRGDVDREQHTVLASQLLLAGNCRGALREVDAAAEWYQARGVPADGPLAHLSARANLCAGDTVSAARDYALWYAGATPTPADSREFGAACETVLAPQGLPVDSLEAGALKRALRADSAAFAQAAGRVRPGITRDSLRAQVSPSPLWRLPRESFSVSDARNRDDDLRRSSTWYVRSPRPTGSRREFHRLTDSLALVEAKLGCLTAAW